MKSVFEAKQLTKRFGDLAALNDLDVTIPQGSIVGLIGKNGCGKTTLLRHLLGLYLPTSGECTTFGHPSGRLRSEHLTKIGAVHQETRFLNWMTVEQHIRYVATFYRTWDCNRERQLREDLEIDGEALVGSLSPGNAQKLALVLALCHHPEFLVLDEPVSSLDPIARNKLLSFLVDLIEEDQATVIVSSHVLRDIEQIVDWVICMDHGRVTVNDSLDALKESYCEWVVTSRNAKLPEEFTEPFVLRQEIEGRRAVLVVREPGEAETAFLRNHDVEVETRPMNLERLFPLLIESPPQ